MEKQTTQFYVLVLNVYVMILQGMVTFDMPLCRQMFNFSSKEDVQSSKRSGKKKRVKECECGGESDTFTPSCQFARGPLLLHYPVLLLLHRPPLGSLCLLFKL